MTLLTTQQKADIKFHYSQAGNPYFADELGLIFLNNFASEEITRITSAIAACNNAYTNTTLNGGTLIEVERTEGDQNVSVTTVRANGSTSTTHWGDRTFIRKRRPTYQQRRSAYFREVEKMLSALGYTQ